MCCLVLGARISSGQGPDWNHRDLKMSTCFAPFEWLPPNLNAKIRRDLKISTILQWSAGVSDIGNLNCLVSREFK